VDAAEWLVNGLHDGTLPGFGTDVEPFLPNASKTGLIRAKVLSAAATMIVRLATSTPAGPNSGATFPGCGLKKGFGRL
jgi:hypothetical protein